MPKKLPVRAPKTPDEILPALKPEKVETDAQEFEFGGRKMRVSVKTEGDQAHAHVEHQAHDGSWVLAHKLPVAKLGEGVYGGIMGGGDPRQLMGRGGGVPMIAAQLKERKVRKGMRAGMSFNELRKKEK
jgi:hypothetical protein